jgi:hypothetical protein
MPLGAPNGLSLAMAQTMPQLPGPDQGLVAMG